MTEIVTMTHEAVDHFAGIAKGMIVTLGLKGGGCTGFTYTWDIKEEVDDTYELVDYDDFKLGIDIHSIMYLMGSVIDYKTGIIGNHIEIENPLATSRCGCGDSIDFDF